MRRREVLQGIRLIKFEEILDRTRSRELSQGEAADRFRLTSVRHGSVGASPARRARQPLPAETKSVGRRYLELAQQFLRDFTGHRNILRGLEATDGGACLGAHNPVDRTGIVARAQKLVLYQGDEGT